MTDSNETRISLLEYAIRMLREEHVDFKNDMREFMSDITERQDQSQKILISILIAIIIGVAVAVLSSRVS